MAIRVCNVMCICGNCRLDAYLLLLCALAMLEQVRKTMLYRSSSGANLNHSLRGVTEEGDGAQHLQEAWRLPSRALLHQMTLLLFHWPRHSRR